MIEARPLQDFQPPVSALDIITVGCGISGLSAAYCLGRPWHKITVLVESASEIKAVGTGIQPPAHSLGSESRLSGERYPLCCVRDEDGQQVGWTRWGDSMRRDYGSTYCHIHRADLLDMLFDLARPYMTLKLNSRVKSEDTKRAKVTLENGTVLSADLIVGADGIRSVVRDAIVDGQPKPPVPTGHAAYHAERCRIMGACGEAGDDFLDGSPEAYCWVLHRTEYNLVGIHSDNREQESYTTESSARKIGWEPSTQLLNLIQSTLVWPLMYREPLDDRVAPRWKVVLVGDACHPMLPSRAQGSVMAVEVPNSYPSLRATNDFVTTAPQTAFAKHNTFHLEDGPRQEERDHSIRSAMELAQSREEPKNKNAGNANIWADNKKSQIQFGYDAEAEAARWCTGIWLEETRTTFRL